jgi:hypothetical protein
MAVAATGRFSATSASLVGAGELRTEAGGTLTAQTTTIGAPLVNEGTLVLRAGTTIGGSVTTVPGSLIQVQGDAACCGATATFTNGFTNNATIELTSINGGTSAQLTVSTGTLTNAPGATIVSAVGGGGPRTLTAAVDNQGTLSVSPGAASSLTITGTLASSGTILLDLGGLTVGSLYDQITVSGAATVDGTLTVSNFGGFLPVIGNSFTILTSPSVSGAFTTVNLPPTGSGTARLATSPTALTVQVN